MLLLSLLLLFHQLGANPAVASPAFNYEITPRVIAEILANLRPAMHVNGLNGQLHGVGGVNLNDTAHLRTVNFAEITSFTLSMIYAGFETGFFMGHMRDTHSQGLNSPGDTFRFTQIDPTKNDTDLVTPHPPRKYWHVNPKTGENDPVAPYKTITSFNHKIRPWYVMAKQVVESGELRNTAAGDVLWTAPYIFSTDKILGITHIKPMVEAGSGRYLGTLAADFGLADIEGFLRIEFGRESLAGVIVFITEGTTGNLVATSVKDQPLLHADPVTKTLGRVHSKASVVPEIAKAAKWLEARGWDWTGRHGNTLDLMGGDMFVEMTTFINGKLEWKIVVLQKAKCPGGSAFDPSSFWCITCELGYTLRRYDPPPQYGDCQHHFNIRLSLRRLRVPKNMVLQGGHVRGMRRDGRLARKPLVLRRRGRQHRIRGLRHRQEIHNNRGVAALAILLYGRE
jgi:hypothetical protein